MHFHKLNYTYFAGNLQVLLFRTQILSYTIACLEKNISRQIFKMPPDKRYSQKESESL